MKSTSLLAVFVVLALLGQTAGTPVFVGEVADVLDLYPSEATVSTATVSGSATPSRTVASQAQPDDRPIERWNRTYGGARDDRATHVVVTDDGFLVAGPTRSFGEATVSRSDLWLLSLDERGDDVWARPYGTGSDERPTILRTPSDDSIFLVGEIGVAEGAILYGLDSAGDVQWRRVYGAGTVVRAGIDLPEGYLLAGGRITGNGTHPGALFDVGTAGERTTTRTFVGRGAAEERFTTIVETRDGDRVFLGESDRTENDVNAWAVRLAPNGSVRWNQVYDSASLQVSTAAAVELPDGDLLVVGTRERNDVESGWIARIDGPTGAMEWRESYRELSFADVVVDDRGALVVGRFREDRAPTTDAVLLAVDERGRERWQERYDGSGDEAFEAIAPTDTGYVLVGSTSSRGAGRADVLVVRLDRPVHVREFSLSSTEVTTDDDVTVTATVVNRLAAPRSHTARLFVDGAVRESKTVDLDPGAETTVTFTTSFVTAGDYAVGVDTVRPRTVTVSEPTPEPTAEPTATAAPTPESTPEPTPPPETTETTSPGFGPLVTLVALAVALVVAVAVRAGSRRRR